MEWLAPSLDWVGNPVVVLRQLMAGLANGMLLFLVASGLTLIFGVTRIINLAHGSFFMLGAYVAFTAVTLTSQSLPYFALAVLAGTLVTFGLGVLFERFCLRRVYRSAQAYQLLITFGLVLIVGDGVKLIWGKDENSISVPPLLDGFIRPSGVNFPVYRLVLIGAGLIVCLAFWLLLYRSRWGVLIRAATVDRDMLQALGVDIRTLFTAVFGVGAGLAGFAGALAAPLVSIGPGLHAQILIDAFVIVVIGGMGSFPGALLGALLIGQANAFGVLIYPSLAIVVPFIIMTLLLILRPRGLLGRAE